MKKFIIIIGSIWYMTIMSHAESNQSIPSNIIPKEDLSMLKEPLISENNNSYYSETYDIIHYNSAVNIDGKMVKDLTIRTKAVMHKQNGDYPINRDWMMGTLVSITGDVVKGYMLNPMYVESLKSAEFTKEKPKKVQISLEFDYKKDHIDITTVTNTSSTSHKVFYRDFLYKQLR